MRAEMGSPKKVVKKAKFYNFASQRRPSEHSVSASVPFMRRAKPSPKMIGGFVVMESPCSFFRPTEPLPDASE